MCRPRSFQTVDQTAFPDVGQADHAHRDTRLDVERTSVIIQELQQRLRPQANTGAPPHIGGSGGGGGGGPFIIIIISFSTAAAASSSF